MFDIRRLFIALGIGFIVSLATMFLLINTSVATWDAMQPATCLASGMCFCEWIDTQSPIRQFANTFSSLGFVFAGVLIVAMSGALKGSRLPSMFGSVLGVCAVIVGVGSAYYHASLTFVGQFFDILGMYLMASFVLVYALQRLSGWTNARSIAAYVTLNVFLTVIQILIPDLRRYTFAIVLIIGLVVEFLYLRQRKPTITLRWLYSGLALFALAYAIWIVDNSRLICEPESLLQGHALWHLLGAASTVCLFLYYGSEAPATSPTSN